MKNDNNNSEEKKYKPKVEMKPTYRKKRWSKTVSSKTKPHTKNIRNPTNDNINNNINNSNNNTQKLDIIMANYSQARKMRRTRKTGSIYMVGISFLVFVFSYLGKGRGGGLFPFSVSRLFIYYFLTFSCLVFFFFLFLQSIVESRRLQINKSANDLSTLHHHQTSCSWTTKSTNWWRWHTQIFPSSFFFFSSFSSSPFFLVVLSFLIIYYNP